MNWRLHRAVHYWFRVPMIIGAATVPVLAGLSASKYTTAIVGLVVAVLAGVDSFFQLGTRWQQQRHAYCLLSLEGWHFIELSGPYEKQSTHSGAYKAFLKQLEALNGRLSLTHLEVFQREPAPRQGSP